MEQSLQEDRKWRARDKNVRAMNEAFIMKLGWNIKVKKDELWVQVLREMGEVVIGEALSHMILFFGKKQAKFGIISQPTRFGLGHCVGIDTTKKKASETEYSVSELREFRL